MALYNNTQRPWDLASEVYAATSRCTDPESLAMLADFERKCAENRTGEEAGPYMLLGDTSVNWKKVKTFIEDLGYHYPLVATGVDYIRTTSRNSVLGLYLRSDSKTQLEFLRSKCSQATQDQCAGAGDGWLVAPNDVCSFATILTDIHLPEAVLSSITHDEKQGVIIRHMSGICREGRRTGNQDWKSEVETLRDKCLANFEETVAESHGILQSISAATT